MHLYRLLADLVVIFHAAYVAFVVLGFIGILAGIASGSSWMRSPGFRTAHLAAIMVVCAESIAGVTCPLTALEASLRQKVGEPAYSADFLAYWIHMLIFYDFPAWVFAVCYAVFGLLVVVVFLTAPPRWPGRHKCRDAVCVTR